VELVSDYQSCMDMVDDALLPSMSCVLSAATDGGSQVSRPRIARFLLHDNRNTYPVSQKAVVEVFGPLTDDLRTFPPPTGRTAPSIDGSAQSVATEIAPYIRHIVWLDQQQEKQRAEIDASSQGAGRQRRTRAARAAAEGGNVANTRVEPWFPKELDFSAVLATGGDWHDGRDQWLMLGVTPNLSRESTKVTGDTTMEWVDEHYLTLSVHEDRKNIA
jgi:hypothetical protein